jgi:nucleotide-binding universal stress UspA family protein
VLNNIHPGSISMKLQRIVVGVDGSTNSLGAVEWAAGLAEICGAEIVAVHALGLLEHLQGSKPTSAHAHREEIRDHFEAAWCAPLDRAGIRCRKLLRDGSPVSVLLEMAEHEDADLIVMGSRGLGGYPELLLGSTSTQVAQNTSRPVTIVPRRG